MDINGISFQDIEAFAKLNRVELHVWEVQALEAIDATVRRAWSIKRPRQRTAATNREDGLIPATNVSGIKALMRGLVARKERRSDG